MSGINPEWALSQLDDFIGAPELTYIPSPPGTAGSHAYRTAEPEVEVVRRAQVVEQILDRIIPRWRGLAADATEGRWAVHREASIRAREALKREDELRENLGAGAPVISAANLHPWVWSGAKSLWQSGHFRSAVEDAAKKVNAETQNKLGRRDVSETNLLSKRSPRISHSPESFACVGWKRMEARRTNRPNGERGRSPKGFIPVSAIRSTTRIRRTFRSR